MALDDKVFLSAIARINKIKAKQSHIPQIQVFEDPPHLKYTDAQVAKNDNNRDRKPATNETAKEEREAQTELNRVHNQGTEKGTEIGYKVPINQKKELNRVHNQGTKKGTEIGYKLDSQSASPLDIYPDFIYRKPYRSLIGIPKKIIDVIFDICRKYSSKETPPLPLSTIVRLCNEKKNSIKVARQRLLEEGIISTQSPTDGHAKGRSGKLVYKIRDDMFDEINNSLSLLIRDRNIYHKKGTESGSCLPSSSSNNIYTTTTSLPIDWLNIDLSPLKEINFGLMELKNIFKKCPQDIHHHIVQDSINQFAFGLKHNPERYKTMHAPSGILVKSLCEGNPWVENGYVSQEEKLKIEKENKITKMIEQQFKEPKFIAWFNELNEMEKENLVPTGIKSSASYLISKLVIQKDHAYKYFDREIWPSILTQLKGELI